MGYFLFLIALSVVTVVLSRRARVPYSIGLVVAGIGLGLLANRFPIATKVRLSPETLGLLLPALLFEGAFQLPAAEVKRSLRPILLLAVPGVALGQLVSWLFLSLGMQIAGTPVPALELLLFGAIVSATDPVAVISILRELKAPKRIRVILDAESLLNDGVAVVAFNAVLALLPGETHRAIGQVLIHGAWEAASGIVLGAALGEAATRITRRQEEPLVSVAISLFLAYGAYSLASIVHASPILAVVAAGFTFGNRDDSRAHAVDSFWEVLAFGANTVVFFLMGIELAHGHILSRAPMILIAWLSLLVGRAIFVTLFTKGLKPEITVPEHKLLTFAGLRGGLSMVLAMSLPESPMRERIVELTFGVIVISLFGQGLLLAFRPPKGLVSEA